MVLILHNGPSKSSPRPGICLHVRGLGPDNIDWPSFTDNVVIFSFYPKFIISALPTSTKSKFYYICITKRKVLMRQRSWTIYTNKTLNSKIIDKLILALKMIYLSFLFGVDIRSCGCSKRKSTYNIRICLYSLFPIYFLPTFCDNYMQNNWSYVLWRFWTNFWLIFWYPPDK